MKRGTAALMLVWSVAFGAWSTKNFAQRHELYELGCALVDLVCAAFWAGRIWSKP